MNKGYDYDEVRALASEFGFITHIRARSGEAVQIKREAAFRARRWVVQEPVSFFVWKGHEIIAKATHHDRHNEQDEEDEI